MSDHYYSKNPISKKEERDFEVMVRGEKLSFQTDAGVFSKKGLDFGSRFLIESVDLKGACHILDLGCGYGPIGLSIAKMNPNIHVTMVDINERAVELAKKNAVYNRLSERVNIFVSDRFEKVAGMKFDCILLNPPIRTGKTVIYQMFAEAKRHLHDSGSFWIVIRKQQGAESACTELHDLFSSVEVVERKKGYWVIRAGF
ncbi:16S rRNA (guanine1207-N2)-methyltransferase [Thermoactinomyces sp. DSM 45891]|uniref:class I SAM-dependent methyltransferase n=1 Tax=Thermoactinomyces sp. DSM 45891 TaxID=1761907 RepID=UPI00090F02E4|nr:class I SAM-dependent methyltransferase [Thermoactinomyces sp. DSM 45891]SFX38805.1 16S rRNA (guanine1207-N2)-methyltransferase [Thermoactinomyces sp. DSM 45891]